MHWTWRGGSSGHRSHMESWCFAGPPFCQKLSRGEISPPVDLSADPRPAQRNVSWTWRRRSRNISRTWRGWDSASERRFRLEIRDELYVRGSWLVIGNVAPFALALPPPAPTLGEGKGREGKGRGEITGSGQPLAVVTVPTVLPRAHGKT